MGRRLERHLDTDLIDRMEAGWTPASRPRPLKRIGSRRPLTSYRPARRNGCSARGMVWSSSWYVPRHQANYGRGWPSFSKAPGRYPMSLLSLHLAWRQMKERARAARRAMLQAVLSGKSAPR